MAFFNEIMPSHETIAGQDVKMLFTMGAAARMESELNGRYPELVLEMLQIDPEGGKKAEHAMSIERQAAIVRILMQEAGQDVTQAELTRLHMLDFAALVRLAQREILLKSPQGDAKKNGDR